MKWTYEEIDGKHGVFEGGLLVAVVGECVHPDRPEYAKEFAEKIVTAVNAHDHLVAALQEAHKAATKQFHGDIKTEAARIVKVIEKAIEDALALAGKVGE